MVHPAAQKRGHPHIEFIRYPKAHHPVKVNEFAWLFCIPYHLHAYENSSCRTCDVAVRLGRWKGFIQRRRSRFALVKVQRNRDADRFCSMYFLLSNFLPVLAPDM